MLASMISLCNYFLKILVLNPKDGLLLVCTIAASSGL